MNKERIAQLEKRIDDTFAGKGGTVGGDHLADLIKHEKQMSQHLILKFRGYVGLMDAFFDFYIETHRKASDREETKWPHKTIIFTLMHIATLWRFRASYLDFWNGYFVDASSHLRAVLENVFSIAALHSGITTAREMFGDGGLEETKNRSGEEAYKLLRTRVSKCDKKIRRNMIGKQSGLSPDAQKDLRILVRSLHMSVHKAQINFISGYEKWVVQHQPLSFFPPYDEDWVSLYLNFSLFLGWMVTRTLPLLQIRSGEFSSRWGEKYNVLNESFQVAVGEFPKRLGRSVEELINKKFEFDEAKDL